MSLRVYDDFDNPDYSLNDYREKWMNPNGLGEMAVADTRTFSGELVISAVPFKTGHDVGVADHLKYFAVSTQAFPVPVNGTLVLSSEIKAATSGTVPNLTQQGVYGPSGSWRSAAERPAMRGYAAPVLQAQQAAVVMNALDFCTGQVFDWFVASDTAFALIERLPSSVTGNLNNPDCKDANDVGIDEMYTQIIREIPVQANVWHHVDIALTRHDGDAWVDYFFDFQPVAHVGNIGIPLDKQGVSFTGVYPSLGHGERLAGRIHSLQFGHGLFSLLDGFPFQFPAAPEVSVSIPVGDGSARHAGRARLFGQGARGVFRRFSTLTLSNEEEPLLPSELAEVLVAAHRSTPPA